MYRICMCVLAIMIILGCNAQTQAEHKFDFGKRIVAGVIDKGQIKLKIDPSQFLQELNDRIYKGEAVLDMLTIESGVTGGTKEIAFNYLKASSSTKNITVVRYLTHNKNELSLDLKENGEFYSFESYFVSCEGTDKCHPRLFYINEKFSWSCRENYQCVSPEEAERDKCVLGTILL